MGEWFLHPFSMQIIHLFPITGPAQKCVGKWIIFCPFGAIYLECPKNTCTPLKSQEKRSF